MKILFVGMSDSVHSARWLAQLASEDWEISLLPVQTVAPHPDLMSVTIHPLLWYGRLGSGRVPTSSIGRAYDRGLRASESLVGRFLDSKTETHHRSPEKRRAREGPGSADPHEERDLRTVRYNGQLIDIEGTACLISAVVDITDRKRLESQLQQAQKLEAVGQPRGGIAHDFNNMLSVILGQADLASQLLRPGTPPAKASRKYEKPPNVPRS